MKNSLHFPLLFMKFITFALYSVSESEPLRMLLWMSSDIYSHIYLLSFFPQDYRIIFAIFLVTRSLMLLSIFGPSRTGTTGLRVFSETLDIFGW